MIYSIVPIEVIFSENIPEYKDGNLSIYKEIEYLGEKVQVRLISDNQYVINRLISTSPQAYLNSKLQPGTLINIRPE